MSEQRRGKGTNATIRDVASAANVSIATVSRVLRGHTTVTSATRDRVLQAVEELRFTPSRLGRSLAERQHAANGIVFPDLSGPYYAEVVLGYEAVASELDRSVLILSTHGRAAATERVHDLAGRVDGLVILGRTVSDEVIAQVAARGLPVVVLARPPVLADGSGENLLTIDSVNAENTDAARQLARHLVERGVRHPVLVGAPESSPDVAQRWSAAAAAFLAAGLETPRIIAAGLSESEGARVATELLDTTSPTPDALVCANDELALGALSVLRRRGVDVPGSVLVTGWDDVMAARWADLTTVSQPMRELGARAARLLDLRIRGEAGPARHEVLPTRLVERSTTDRPH